MRIRLILTAGLAALTLAACSGRDETVSDEAAAYAETASDATALRPDAPAPTGPDMTTPADPDNPTGPVSPPDQTPPTLPADPANPGAAQPSR